MPPHLIQLLALNKNRGFIRADATSADEATLYLYDVIVSDAWYGGVAALDFIQQLNMLTQPTIHLRINSPGGDVFAARAIVQAMREHPSNIVAHVDGMAASAATFLAIAADQSYIADGAMFMIHNAWSIAAGNAADFTAMADLLNRTDQTIINDYMAKTGCDQQTIADWMDAETYFFGQDAVDNGFIDAIAEAPVKNEIKWDLSCYKNPDISGSRKQPNPPPTDQQKRPPPPPAPPEKPAIDLSNHYRRLALIQKTAA